MDVPVVLSHKTAWLLWHAPRRAEVMAACKDYDVGELGITPRQIGERVRQVLLTCGIPQDELATLDVLTSFAPNRPCAQGFCAHVHGSILTADRLVSVVPGLMVVGAGLCFLEAATWMSYLELVEFGYEICGWYEIPLLARGEGYAERSPLSSCAAIRAMISERTTAKGVKLARRALARVRDGSRSPMETASAMMVVVPKRYGGLGYRGIELNHRVDVPPELRRLSASAYFELDLYAGAAHLDLEYDGGEHAADERRAHDAERSSVLGAMGITVQVLTKGQFASQLALHRAMNAVAYGLGVRLDPTPAFQRAQNELRKFVIRGWSAT